MNFGKNCTLEPCSVLKIEWKNPLHGAASHTRSWAESIVRRRKWHWEMRRALGSSECLCALHLAGGLDKAHLDGDLTTALHMLKKRHPATWHSIFVKPKSGFALAYLCRFFFFLVQIFKNNFVLFIHLLNHNSPIIWESFIIWGGRSCL